MTTLPAPAGEEPLGGGARLVDGVGDLPGGDGQALGDEQRLGVGFLDLHAADEASGGGRDGRRDGTASARPRRPTMIRNEPRAVASPYSSSAASRPRHRRGA